MDNQENSSKKEHKSRKRTGGGSSSDAVYGMALIGSAIYFIQHAATFWEVVLGILKAIVWPAIVIYKLLDFLKM